MKSIPVLTGLLLVLFPTTSLAEVRVYFGNLHAHSNLSDGNESTPPAEAYRIAKEEGAMDFLCLSEHNHMLTPDEMTTLIAAADQATGNGFVALFGQEFSTINKGFNHTNIENYPEAIPKERNGHYAQVFGTDLTSYISGHPGTVIVAGFNHPADRTRDYGMSADFNGNWDAFTRTLNPYVKLIAIGNGPADVNDKGFQPSASNRFLHRGISTTAWFDYLSHGFRLGPKIDHDSHSPTYGIRVEGRTAVWVDDVLTKDKLLDALAHRHCYATQDRNLEIVPTLEGGGLPGDELAATGNPVRLTLRIRDTDEPGAKYTVVTLSGIPGSGEHPKPIGSLKQSLNGDGTVMIDLPAGTTAEIYYVFNVEQDSPNPPCGTAKDVAWLSPLWFGTPSDTTSDDVLADSYAYVGSKNSKVYHYPNCKNVKYIDPDNLVTYAEPPPGKRLHQGCPK